VPYPKKKVSLDISKLLNLLVHCIKALHYMSLPYHFIVFVWLRMKNKLLDRFLFVNTVSILKSGTGTDYVLQFEATIEKQQDELDELTGRLELQQKTNQHSVTQLHHEHQLKLDEVLQCAVKSCLL